MGAGGVLGERFGGSRRALRGVWGPRLALRGAFGGPSIIGGVTFVTSTNLISHQQIYISHQQIYISHQQSYIYQEQRRGEDMYASILAYLYLFTMNLR